MTCRYCHKPTTDYGNGSLGSQLTPRLTQPVHLCQKCWILCLANSPTLKAWEEIMLRLTHNQ